ncbi:MAG TPA: F0F1 ATP synthase subunit A [Acidisarcina sp.]
MKALLVLLHAALNHWFGAPVTALLLALHLHPTDPVAPISETYTLELFIAALLLLFFIVARATLDVERPGPVQWAAEWINEFVTGQASAVMDRGYETHLPFVTTILLFVLACNLFGLLPGIDTPTANPVVPLAIAALTFLYYNFYGVKAQGIIGYIKHFMGPVWWLSPLLFPVEIISHLSRVVSLTIRLYANMFASDMLTLVFFSMVPLGFPIVFLGLHLGVAFIQAYVFMLLAIIYLSIATTHEEHEKHEESGSHEAKVAEAH